MLPTIRRTCLRLLLCLALSGLGACASIVEGTDQDVTIQTQPPGASCKLLREGLTIGWVASTPGTVNVDKDNIDITVHCSKDRYHPSQGILLSGLEPMTFGNLLIGGVIGAAIDATSGAMYEYPEIITLTLAPRVFATLVERDRFYDRLVDEVKVDSAKAIAKIQQDCKPDRAEQCEEAVEKVEMRREERLAELEEQRQGARVGAKPSE